MYLLGIDIGTSGTKSAIFNTEGELISLASKEYVFESVKPGYAEQDPDVWWKAVVFTVKEAIKSSRLNAEQISVVGLSGQMHGLVALDKNGKVLRKAILHCDVRAAKEVDEIKEISNGRIEKITFNPIFPGFQAVSLYWMKKHEKNLYDKIFKVVCPKDYIRYKMTGLLGTEHTDASGTLLYDMKNSKWSYDIFRILELKRELVPEEINKSYEVAGNITSEASKELGLSTKTIVAYGGADQAMHSTGNGIYQSGIEMATIGTSGQVLRICNEPIYNASLNTHLFKHVNDNTWYGLGAVLFAGSTLNWYKRTFCNDIQFDEISMQAESVEPGSEGLIFFPCMGGERTPYMDPNTRGVFLGVNVAHNKWHFARAIMEGVSFAMKCSIDKMDNLYGQAENIICAGGGVKGNVWAQIQADVYGRSIHISSVKEQACLGAAIVAGIAGGGFKDLNDACGRMCNDKMKVLEPIASHREIYDKIYKDIYLQIYKSNKDIFKKINQTFS